MSYDINIMIYFLLFKKQFQKFEEKKEFHLQLIKV